MLGVPAGKKNSQVKRLRGIARRVEFLWGLVRQRLEISEREIRRHIDVWGADDLPTVTGAVPREKILADLEAPGTPYWRLKMLMDAWCALWFWPLDSVGLLDGSAAQYERDVVIVRHPAQAQPAGDAVVAPSWAKESLFDFDLDGSAEPSESSESSLPGTSKSSSTAGRTAGKVKASAVERLRRLVPLRSLDDWLTFAEALVGAKDIAADSLGAHFTSLAALEEYENGLEGWMGMDGENRLPERFPWLGVVREIADRQGFFHWELHFAQAFAGGGFDLQVGNPPWVRPDWDEPTVLAELDPWFKLVDRISVDDSVRRKVDLLKEGIGRRFFLNQMVDNVGLATMLASPSVYPLIAGTRPDLYRAFMCTVWSNLHDCGIAGLIHPDTHFSGVKEGLLRAASYEHLRFHAHFSNRLQLFSEIEGTRQFGVHVYGLSKKIEFVHVSWLFEPSTLSGSLVHGGSGDMPGIKNNGKWELRPHRARMIEVDEKLLAQWQKLSGETGTPLRETALLYPVTTDEQGAIAALASTDCRLAKYRHWISRGFDEMKAKKDGLIRWESSAPNSLSNVILQGPHFGIATPFNKEPKVPCRTNRDWSYWDLRVLAEDAVPRTNYVPACDPQRFTEAQDVWDGRHYTEYFRLSWRRMIPFDTERSLFSALLPPGPTHVSTAITLSLAENRHTALCAGFWTALPLDYLLRVVGRSDLQGAEAPKMPAPDFIHPLAEPLLLRTLRLNCLTGAYASFWSDIFDSSWSESEIWAVGWSRLSPLGEVGPEWNWATPLRAERERRCALVEIDALVAVWLNITADQLVAIYRSRYPVLSDYEARMWFDANGRKIAGNHNTYGHGQTKEHYVQLMAHLEDPERVAPPEGYSPPFYKADREGEMRQAHAVFSARLQAAKDAGWTP